VTTLAIDDLIDQRVESRHGRLVAEDEMFNRLQATMQELFPGAPKRVITNHHTSACTLSLCLCAKGSRDETQTPPAHP
jgi:hypothetical protein